MATAEQHKHLLARLTVYPQYLAAPQWLDRGVRRHALEWADAEGLVRDDSWRAGVSEQPPQPTTLANRRIDAAVTEALDACLRGEEVDADGMLSLFSARGADVEAVCAAADELRQTQVGNVVSYVINRNINYTNVCQYSCRFCAFSKGGGEVASGRTAYDLDGAELHRRVQEAAALGATEVCLQGGIHPDYTGQTYLDIVETVKAAAPDMHVHAFSPLEIDQGAKTLGLSLERYLTLLKDAGLDSLPGTAAEVLDEDVRAILCPDKVTSDRWLEIMECAHEVGLFSTATIMFGHVDSARAWVTHWQRVAELQTRTGGFTEVVPLPFVSEGAPLYRRGESRPGPTWREARLMHAVLRLTVGQCIPNIQASWVKLGHAGALEMLSAGANDLGGVLINESITRAAGAAHGQMWHPEALSQSIVGTGRIPQQRNTRYEPVQASAIDLHPAAIRWVGETPAGRLATSKTTRIL
jgi:FO synthase